MDGVVRAGGEGSTTGGWARARRPRGMGWDGSAEKRDVGWAGVWGDERRGEWKKGKEGKGTG